MFYLTNMKKLIPLVFLFASVKAQVPYGLSSNPSARPTAFLDFDGQTVTTIYWNAGATIFCQPSVLTTTQMIRVFNQVAEDYRAFTINITTDSAVYFAAPITRRTRIIITPTYEWYSAVGGTAFIESFRWGLDVPCFAFDGIFNGNDKRVAEVVSHEIGHTLGLYHQSQYRNIGTDSCGFVAEYFSGRGSGDVGWAPIMGNSYFRNLTLWATGLTVGCNFPQNDIEVITTPINGVTLRPDDVGNTLATARVTPVNSDFGGMLTDSVDVDYFRFDVTVPGRFTLNAVPYSVGASLTPLANITGAINYASNIDIELTLLRNNDVLGVYNPTTRLDATIDILLNPGTYYVKLNSVSNSNTTRYGMIGSYTLSGRFSTSVTVPIRNINLSCYNSSNKHVLTWSIESDEIVNNVQIDVSTDGVNWNKLTSVSNKSYSYVPVDEKTFYYRLSAKEFSGEKRYSNTCVIKEQEDVSVLQIGNKLQINTNSGGGEWKILDVQGKLLQKGVLIKGTNYINITKNIGVIFLQVADKQNVITKKLILQ